MMQSVRICASVIGTGVLLLAQHGYTPGDVEEGEQLFIENCAICHGPDGDAVPGVELARGKFRHASSDEELTQIITKGIPGTAMPPGNFHEHQVHALVAYLHSMSTSISSGAPVLGDAAPGKVLFEGRGECLKCHRVNDKGSYVGPDLTDIGIIRRSGQLERSILEPDAEILPQNRFFRVVSKDGAVVTGRLLNLDTFTVQLMDSTERLQSFSKSDLKEYGFIDKSPMPSYRRRLSQAEISDVVAYLVTLKGAGR